MMEVGINAGAVEAGLRWGACPRTKEGEATEGGKGEGGPREMEVRREGRAGQPGEKTESMIPSGGGKGG